MNLEQRSSYHAALRGSQRGFEGGGGRSDAGQERVAGLDQPFRSALGEHLKGHTEALEGLAVEMLARGLSVRDSLK